MGPRLKIGIVLSSLPSYSETFFHLKLNGLIQNGYKIIVFAPGTVSQTLQCRIIKPYPVFSSTVLRFISVAFVLAWIYFRKSGNVNKFWKYEKRVGSSTGEIIKRLYLNGHILTQTLDWLYFGFATTAINREQVARAIGAKMAVSFRGYDINVFPLRNPGCYDQVWKGADKVHSISRYLLEKAFALGLPTNKPARIITPAVKMPPQPKSSFEFLDVLKLVSVARLHWIKGLEYSIQAVAILKSKGIRLQYTIIGEGAEQEKLLFEIQSLNLQKEVRMIGKLAHQNTILKMAESDIYLQPSLNEGFCNAVLEAQSMGCLCVVSDAGALSENVINGVTGWLVPPRNAQALAEAILKIIHIQPEERTLVSEQAIKRVAEKFAIKDHLAAWRMFYEESVVNL